MLHTRYVVGGGPRPYDVSADGQRFLMLKEAPSDDKAPARDGITVVANWFEELKKRVPAKSR